MKLSILLWFLSLTGNYSSEKEIPYRTLTWEDFRGLVPENEPTVAARTVTELEMETTEIAGRFRFVVKSCFLADSSFVRVRTDRNLHHEQTHFKIACIEARKCILALAPLQGGDSTDKSTAFTVYEHYFAASESRNDQFDRETNHCLNAEAEKIWEDRISLEMRIFGNSLKTAHGRNR